MKALQTILVVCFALMILPAHAQTDFTIQSKLKKNQPAPPPKPIDAPFDRIQNNSWAIVLVGPEEDPRFVSELEMLTAEALTLKERNIVVIQFNGRRLKTFPEISVSDYELPSMKGSKKGRSSHQKIKTLEEKLMIDDDMFAVVLVDINGSIKYAWPQLVTPKDIYKIMDNPEPVVFERPLQTPNPPAP